MFRSFLLAGAALGVPAAALAQSEADAEIVVLGTREQGYRATVAPQTNKSDTPLKETPYSVQVVTRELIRDRGITTIGEALRYVPGFTASCCRPRRSLAAPLRLRPISSPISRGRGTCFTSMRSTG